MPWLLWESIYKHRTIREQIKSIGFSGDAFFTKRIRIGKQISIVRVYLK
jgi:hypothetical protein